jgi:glycosyltransferase involved in cell wall biosynthesis
VKLSVIVPVYNEEATVGQLLQKLVKVRQVKEVIVVDDGSTDDSLRLIKKVGQKTSKLQVLSKENGGKGSAIIFGLDHVTGDHVLIQDADLEYDPDDIPVLIEPIKKGRVEVVYGSRFLGSHSNLLFWHRLGNSFLNLVTNVMYNTTLSDLETCYKVIPTQLFRDLNIKSTGFDIEPEITCKILRRGIRIYEVPISYVGRDFSQGKKITWRDGISALRVILALRLVPWV